MARAHAEAVSSTERHEVAGVLAATGAVFVALALVSWEQGDWMGPVGAGVAFGTRLAFGHAAYGLVLGLAVLAARAFGAAVPSPAKLAASACVATLFSAVLFHLAWGGAEIEAIRLPGGVVGEVAGEILRGLFSTAGAGFLAAVAIVVTLLLTTRLSVVGTTRLSGRVLRHAAVRALHAVTEGTTHVLAAWKRSREILDAEPPAPARPGLVVRAKEPISFDDDPAEAAAGAATEPDGKREGSTARSETAATASAAPAVAGNLVVRAPKKARRERVPHPEQVPAPEGGYVLPPLSLLDRPPEGSREIDREAIHATARRLVEALAHFEVEGRVAEAQPGPVVTMYEFEPAPGTRIARVASLSDDLAMALEAQKVRIVAPIPGKNRIGFEVPNPSREMVYLRELLADERFQSPRASTLPLALGKDIIGDSVFGDLARMPHLLVAGATGTGKSVGLNAMLASLLYRFTPTDLRLLMIDPKVVELQVFDGIPHLLLPVQTDMRRASLALRWAVDEMERRFQLFADFGARGIQSYNRAVEAIESGERPPPPGWPKRVVHGKDAEGNVVELPPDDGEDVAPQLPQKLPFIVVVVDEFADLMMVAAKDVEGAIQRLAQKARAAGIHLILATQRPSVNVITGTIKANFPCRIGFRVASKQDSRVIFEENGAESLLGQGDMLFLGPGTSNLQRIHGAFVSDEEVKKLADFLRAQGSPIYDDGILRVQEGEDEESSFEEEGADELYDQAVRLVAETRKASVSYVQRRLRIGYNRAARLVERMEREGVVGPAQGSGREREVLVQSL